MSNGVVDTSNATILKCTICWEVPIPPIYQCQNGHILCNGCIGRISRCGVCRVPLPPTAMIRNIALENLFQDRVVQCPNARMGCEMTASLENMSHHLHGCPYTAVSLCQEIGPHLNCGVEVTDSTVFQHLSAAHKLPVFDRSNMRLKFLLSRVQPKTELTWLPLLIKTCGYVILFRVKLLRDGYLIFQPILLQSVNGSSLEAERELKGFRVELVIHDSKMHSALHWSGQPVPYRNLRNASYLNSLRFPLECIEGYMNSSAGGDTPAELLVNITFWKNLKANGAKPELSEELEKSRMLIPQATVSSPCPSSNAMPPSPPTYQYGQSHAMPITMMAAPPTSTNGSLASLLSSPPSGRLFPSLKCSYCFAPLTTMRYKCLECNFEVCQHCMERKIHAHHLLVVIQDQRQNDLVNQRSSSANNNNNNNGNYLRVL